MDNQRAAKGCAVNAQQPTANSQEISQEDSLEGEG